MIPFVQDDGGRVEAGFKGRAGDCTCRAIAIASRRPYQEVYDRLNALSKEEVTRRVRRSRRSRPSSARTGVARSISKAYFQELGATWTPTMSIGSGCRVHLRADELPPGRLVVNLSGHHAAVIDGVLHDTHDCSREGMRCVYGYWTFPAPQKVLDQPPVRKCDSERHGSKQASQGVGAGRRARKCDSPTALVCVR